MKPRKKKPVKPGGPLPRMPTTLRELPVGVAFRLMGEATWRIIGYRIGEDKRGPVYSRRIDTPPSDPDWWKSKTHYYPPLPSDTAVAEAEWPARTPTEQGATDPFGADDAG